MKPFHLLLTGLSGTIILLSLNRLLPLTNGYLQPYDFLRWVDINAMIPIPLITVILYYFLKRNIQEHTSTTTSKHQTLFNILFIIGVYFFAAGSGDHEVTNYLNNRFCNDGEIQSVLCNIIIYNDDTFSHILYYIGFVLLNLALLLTEFTLPRKTPIIKRDLAFISVNGLFIAAGIFANLAFEPAGLDLMFFTPVAALSVYLTFFGNKPYHKLPASLYLSLSYGIGVLSTYITKLVL
jgi:hypothetical protein